MNRKLSFEQWYDIFNEEIYIELAETGADRELEYNPEEEFGRRYEMYLNDEEI